MTNPFGISQKWIIEIGNWPAKYKCNKETESDNTTSDIRIEHEQTVKELTMTLLTPPSFKEPVAGYAVRATWAK